jgi:hypothetical protein
MTFVGIGWYKKEQWEELRRVSVDKERLEATWDDWAENAERTMVHLMQQGHHVEKVTVDVSDLVAWCQKKGRPCDGDARAMFVTDHLRSR